MKKYLLILLPLLFSFYGNAQTVTESLINLREKFNPFLGTESSVLSIDYVREYALKQTDTIYYMIIKVNKTTLESQGISIGTSIFGSNTLLGNAVSANASYQYDKKEGEMIFDNLGFNEFYECAQNIYRFISERQAFGQEKLNTVSYCEVGNITLGAELVLAANNESLKYYFRVGDNAVFQMNKVDFEKIMALLRRIKDDWGKR